MSQSPLSLQVARRVLSRESGATGRRDDAVVAAELQRACLRVTENLRDAMGSDGCDALLERALARAEPDHASLKNIRRLTEDGIYLDQVQQGIKQHGVVAVTAAIEALLAALVDVLGRLIGNEMAIRLIDHDVQQTRASRGAQAP